MTLVEAKRTVEPERVKPNGYVHAPSSFKLAEKQEGANPTILTLRQYHQFVHAEVVIVEG